MEITAEEIERAHFRSRKMYQMDLAYNLAESKQIGFEKGERRGIEKEKLELAKKSLSLGLTVDMVQTITGLSREEIDRL